MTTLSDWDYDLPEGLIATRPLADRDESRLLCVNRGDGSKECRFRDLPSQLRRDDLLVVNNTRVMAARLRSRRKTGGQIEIMMLENGAAQMPLQALLSPARRLKEGEILTLEGGGEVLVNRRLAAGVFEVMFASSPTAVMAQQGEIPLPPYMHRRADAEDRERYQTVYAGELGASAAPTAGLHFTKELFEGLTSMGVGVTEVTLHIGLGTFRPVTQDDVNKGRLHREKIVIPPDAVAAIARTRRLGGRVIAVGTTSARALEAATPAGADAPVVGAHQTEIFIRPPYTPKSFDGLITNFHLPRSSLLMLVGSLLGRDRTLEIYETAVKQEFRFYSYGDAMLIL